MTDLFVSARIIASASDNISYPSRVAAKHVRSVVRGLLEYIEAHASPVPDLHTELGQPSPLAPSSMSPHLEQQRQTQAEGNKGSGCLYCDGGKVLYKDGTHAKDAALGIYVPCTCQPTPPPEPKLSVLQILAGAIRAEIKSNHFEDEAPFSTIEMYLWNIAARIERKGEG